MDRPGSWSAFAALGLLAAALLLSPRTSGAADGAPPESARFIVNLLDYLGADYGGAISASGEVLSASEYAEQVEFAGSALQAAHRVPEVSAAPNVVEKIAALQGLVARKASPADVAALAQDAKRAVIEVAHLAVAPLHWPSLAQGRSLFERNCAVCHGPEGRGDGPAGLALDPKPANFFDAKMDQISPFQAFNVIRVGVPGTAMAAWAQLSDADAWDLAFYVLSLRYQGEVDVASRGGTTDETHASLRDTAARSDQELRNLLPGSAAVKDRSIAQLRLHSEENAGGRSLAFAREALGDAGDQYRAGRFDVARTRALQAYLEGVEPAEPRLRATDAALTATLEDRMAAVRSAMEAREPVEQIEASMRAAYETLDRADRLLAENPYSPWVTFLIAAGILLREGFEAVLIVIALLAVLRSTEARSAAAWVHGGWVAALGLGGISWIFSGWLLAVSGAQRELMEAVTSLLAVAVLLYMGFWLHSKTEIHRWKQFIEGQVKSALAGGNRVGLAGIAFMAVFREAFETVLFLRAVWLEGGDASKTAMALGVVGAFGVVLFLAWLVLRSSARIPVPKVFAVSSVLMIVLSVVLMGKGLHALQETGYLGIRSVLPELRWDTFGIYPTRETLLGQLVVLSLALLLWMVGKRPPVLAPVTQGSGRTTAREI